MRIDAQIPGGNIVVEDIAADTATLRPDMRDSERYWFYWYCRVRDVAGRRLTFRLGYDRDDPDAARKGMVSLLGPAVSRDGGRHWQWLGSEAAGGDAFTYRVPPEVNEVRFSVGMPYTLENLRRFLDGLTDNPAVEVSELTRTRKKRPVFQVRAGDLSGAPRHRILLTARHHACEMMAGYVLEGLLESAVGDDSLGQWFRNQVEILAIPLVDTDGVEDGDPGKWRRPRDHNRDYEGESLHVETAAIRRFVPAWSDGKLRLALDLHCPNIRGVALNRTVYLVGSPEPRVWREQQRFGGILEKVRQGPLPYRAEDNLAFGEGWNRRKNQGSFAHWASSLNGMMLATSIEIPYALVNGVENTPERARRFGRDLARSIRQYLDGER